LTSQTTLPREAGLVYSQAPWILIARAQTFQTLFDPNLPPGPPPYDRVPQLLASLQEVDWKGLTFSGNAEFANFRNPTLVAGQRAYAYPSVAWTKQTPAWYFTAATACMRDTTASTIDDPIAASRATSSRSRRSIRGSCSSATGAPSARTSCRRSEPRAYYVYVPFKDQSKAPVFDTAIDDFNFAQLFSPNRYLGNDRIGDANQITVGLTSRLLDPVTGGERLRVAVAERFYFADQRVTSSEAPRSATSSDFLIGPKDACPKCGHWAGCCNTTSIRGRSSASTLVCAGRPLRQGVQCELSLFTAAGRPGRVADGAEAVRSLDAVAAQRKPDVSRPLELLARRQQDARGDRGRRV
jgi:LPS-assembly protein